MSDNNVKYEILEKGETPAETKVRKTGGVVDFTYGEIQAAIEFANKKMAEIEGQLKISEATKRNIERSNPEVMDMSPQTLIAAYLYREAIGIINGGAAKLQEFQEAMAEDKQALKDIFEQTGLSQVVVEPGESVEDTSSEEETSN